jgi:hypothetical protein
MRVLGVILMFFGFLWIAADIVVFSGVQHGRWIWQTQHLSDSELIGRDEASRAMREYGLALKNHNRVLLLPACIMLIGGLFAACGGWAVRDGERTRRSADRITD